MFYCVQHLVSSGGRGVYDHPIPVDKPLPNLTYLCHSILVLSEITFQNDDKSSISTNVHRSNIYIIYV